MSKFHNLLLIIIILMLQSASTLTFSQNFVGMKEPDVKKYMNANLQNYSIEKDIVNSSHKYLRYSSTDGMQTLLIFFNDRGYCQEVRLTLDRSLHSSKVRELDSEYTRKSDTEWIEKKGKRSYYITLTDETWYYTLKFREIIK